MSKLTLFSQWCIKRAVELNEPYYYVKFKATRQKIRKERGNEFIEFINHSFPVRRYGNLSIPYYDIFKGRINGIDEIEYLGRPVECIEVK